MYFSTDSALVFPFAPDFPVHLQSCTSGLLLTVSVQGCFSSRLAQGVCGCLLCTPPPTLRGDPHSEAQTSPQTVWEGGRRWTGGQGEVLHGETGAIYQQSSHAQSHSQFSV